MNKIAKFSKVPYEIFKESFVCNGVLTVENEDRIREYYDNIKLPARATEGSAGYDFYLPLSIHLSIDKAIIPTGICCEMDKNYVLMLYPRSSLGFKHGVRLLNTTGIIDSDFINGNTHGHIMLALTCDDQDFIISSGDRIVQGIFVPYGITDDDEPVSVYRTGGIGSTGK